MAQQTDRAREAARDKSSGRFGEQHLTDPGPSVLDLGVGDLWAGIVAREQAASAAMYEAKAEAQRRITEWTRIDLAQQLVIGEVPPGSVIRIEPTDWFANREANDPDRTWVKVDEVYTCADDWHDQRAGRKPAQVAASLDYACEVRTEPVWGGAEGDIRIVDFDGFTVDGDPDLLDTDKVLGWLASQIAEPTAPHA